MRRLLWLPVLVAVAAGGAAAVSVPAGAAAGDPYGYVVDHAALDDPDVIARGRSLFATACSTCHGTRGEGLVGPDIRASGAAGAHFWITSGRMPAADVDGLTMRKDPAFPPRDIEALVAYVATLGDGPAIPRIDPDLGAVPEGGELFRSNCAACHQAAGAGGALSYGRNAPTLAPASPVQVFEAIRLGPGQMPAFEEGQLSEEDVHSIIRYVDYLQDADNPGGFSLGRIGPIPEGFVAIGVGLGLACLAAFLIGRRAVAA